MFKKLNSSIDSSSTSDLKIKEKGKKNVIEKGQASQHLPGLERHQTFHPSILLPWRLARMKYFTSGAKKVDNSPLRTTLLFRYKFF